MHYAASKAVGESVREPLAYYANNLGGLVSVCSALRAQGAMRFVFSSSATVYGDPRTLPIPEDAPLAATNPYGQTKLMAEQPRQPLEHARRAVAEVVDADDRVARRLERDPGVGADVAGRAGQQDGVACHGGPDSFSRS